MASTDSVTVALADIDPVRSTLLRHVIFAVLRSTVGKSVFSQVIDGLPVASSYEFMTTGRLDLDSRQEPTEESTALFHQLLDSLITLDHYKGLQRLQN